MKRYTICFLLIFLFFSYRLIAQSFTGSNVVTTALPFLTIAPDSRGGAIGDAGAATSPDVNSQHYNPAKYAFTKSNSGVALSYTPWLRALVQDMNLAYLVGYHKLDEVQVVSSSLKYFDLGSIAKYNEIGEPLETINPNEFAFDLGYSRKLSDYWAGSVALRYMRSDIFQGEEDLYAGNSFAADVAFFYTREFRNARKLSNVSWGIDISNIGNKVSYDKGNIKDFIPTNLRIGGAYSTELDQYNQLSFTLDLNKLLVPSLINKTNEEKWLNGEIDNPRNLGNSEYGVIEGMFRSFADAPDGFQEELKEITLAVGAEYWYSKQFALRTGYFHEAEEKGARQFLTFGAGLKMNVFSLDFSYIFTLSRTSPLENTLRFTLGFDLDDFQNQGRRRK
jgi:hypothetical protein